MEAINKLLKKQIAFYEYVINGIFSTAFKNPNFECLHKVS